MAPFQTAVTLSDDMRDGQEVIEVQILPQVFVITALACVCVFYDKFLQSSPFVLG